MTKNTARIILVCLVVLGIGLRSYHVLSRSLWFDEAFSWRLIQFPFTEMMNRAASDVHPPLYYIVLKEWAVVFGSSLASLRSFSIVLAGATIVAMYAFTAEAWRSRTAGILSAMWLAVSGWQIAFAWEARMYTMGTFGVLVSTYLLLKALRQKQQRPYWWLAYGVVTSAFLYTHYYAIFSITAQAVFLIGYIVTITRGRIGEILQHRLTWQVVFSGAVIALIFSPWLPTFLRQRAQVEQQYWIPKIGGWSIPDTFYRMVAPTSGIPVHHGLGALVTCLPILAVFLGSVWFIFMSGRGASFRSQKNTGTADATYLIIASAWLPFVFSIALSLVSQSLYQDRYFVFANLFLIAGFAGLVASIKWRPAVATVGIGTAVILLGLFARYWHELDLKNKPGVHGATTYVFSHIAPQEPVYASSPFVFFAVAHYAQEEFKQQPPRLYSATGELSHFSGGPILTKADIAGSEIFAGQSAKSFWLVDTTGFGSNELKVPADFKRTDRQVFQEVYNFQGQVMVNHYVAR